MSKRFRDTTKFDRQWYMSLRPRLKCAVDFVLDKCDSAGVWIINMTTLNVGVNSETSISLQEVLQVDAGKQFLEFEPGKIFCIDFIEFQYGTLSEKCKPHVPIIRLLNKYNLLERVLKGYPKGIDTLKEKETDKEMEKEKDFGKSENLLPAYPEKKYPEDFDWAFEKEKFLADDIWREYYIKTTGITEQALKAKITEYMTGIELGQDYKTCSKLKIHFTSWDRKMKKEPYNKSQPTETVHHSQITQSITDNREPTEEELLEAKKFMETMIDNDFTAFCENESCHIKFAVRQLDYLVDHKIYRPTVEQVETYKLQAIEIRKKQLNATYDPQTRITLSHYMSGLLPQGDKLNLVAVAKDLALRDYFRKKREEEQQAEPVTYQEPEETLTPNNSSPNDNNLT